MKYLRKAIDFFSKKDISEIIGDDRYHHDTTYYYKDDKFQIVNIQNDRIPVDDLYQLSLKSYPTIKIKLFLKDILESYNENRLDIIKIKIRQDDSRESYALVTFKEDGFELGDDMPFDIVDEYIDSIKKKMEVRKKWYLDNYNILSSMKTIQRYKYRKSKLYRIEKEDNSRWTLSRGEFTISVCLNLH